MNQVAQIGVQSLLEEARSIWGPAKVENLDKIIVRTVITLGDIGRVARGADKDPRGDKARAELEKELGNLIFSTLRFCDDLGLSPTACIDAAISAQREFAAKNKDR